MFYKLQSWNVNRQINKLENYREYLLGQFKNKGLNPDDLESLDILNSNKQGFNLKVGGNSVNFDYPEGVSKKQYLFYHQLVNFTKVNLKSAPVIIQKILCRDNKTNEKVTFIISYVIEKRSVFYVSETFKSSSKFEYNGSTYTVLRKKSVSVEFRPFKTYYSYLDFGVQAQMEVSLKDMKEYLYSNYTKDYLKEEYTKQFIKHVVSNNEKGVI